VEARSTTIAKSFGLRLESFTSVTTANFSPSDRGGYTRFGQRFQVSSPIRRVDFETIEEESGQKDSVALEEAATEFIPSLWNMEETYKAIRGLRQFSDRIGTIELEDFI
jgi:hypothetical protein